MGRFSAFFKCTGACLAAIPWWVWPVLVLGGAALGAISYLVGLVTAGVGAVVVSALLFAMLWGAVGAVATTFGYCLLGCAPRLKS